MFLDVSLSLCTNKHWSGKASWKSQCWPDGERRAGSSGETEEPFVPMSICLGLWERVTGNCYKYGGKHCSFLIFSTLARDGDVGCINRIPEDQFITWVLSSLACSGWVKCNKLYARFTSAFAGILWSGQRAASQNNKGMCVMPSKSLSIYYCICSGQCHVLSLASELTSVLQTLKGSVWNAQETLSGF